MPLLLSANQLSPDQFGAPSSHGAAGTTPCGKALLGTVAGLAALLGLAGSAAAAVEATHSTRAEALFHQGQILFDAGKYDAACGKFEASETIENSTATLLHLGDCYERVGRNASAWHAFLEAEAVAHAKKDGDGEQVATSRVATLEPKLTRMVFVVPATSRVPGLTVQLGQNIIPSEAWGTVIPIDGGVQHITASAKGHSAWQIDVPIERGDAREYRINVPTLSPTAGPAQNSRRRNLRTAGYVTGGVGIAGIGAAAVFSALSRNPDESNTCSRGAIQCAPSASPDHASYSNAAAVSLAVGGTLLATGITLLVLAPAPDNKEAHALRVAAHPTGSGGRLQLEGVW